MKMIQRIMFWLAVANLVAVLALGWFLFAPVQLPVVYNEPFPVDKEEVRRGENISYEIVLRKQRPYEVESHKNLVCDDGGIIELGVRNTNLPVGEAVIYPIVTIPERAPLSRCFIEVVNEYTINGLRTEVVSMKTVSFLIIE